MKLTKEEWKQLSDRIFLTLRPTQHPVAMKFIKTPEEFDEIPGIEFCQNKASTCKLIGMRSEERRVGKECRSRWAPYH